MKNSKIVEFEKMTFSGKKELIISMLEKIGKVWENSRKILVVVRKLEENELNTKILIDIYAKIEIWVNSIKSDRLNEKINIFENNKKKLEQKLNEEKDEDLNDENFNIEKLLNDL